MADSAVAEKAETPKVDAAPPKEVEKKGGQKKTLLIGVLAGSLALGAAVGGFSVAPMVIDERNSAASEKDQHSDEKQQAKRGDQGSGSHGKVDHRDRGLMVEIDNVIVNPAGSQGTNFLMASVGIEVPDEKASDFFHHNETLVRDEVVTILSSQTMEDLIRPHARDSVRAELAKGLLQLKDDMEWIRIYLPQFVIQ